MLVPFRKETLESRSFRPHEIRHHLLYRISEGECATALQTADGGAVALQNEGRNLWIWIDPDRDREYARSFIGQLAHHLRGTVLPGMVAAPGAASAFAEAYCSERGCASSLTFRLMAYECPRAVVPKGVPGNILKAGEAHGQTVAEYLAGFDDDCFHASGSREHYRETAARLIADDSLYLWRAGGRAVSMAGVTHRSARHARIGYVYTPPAERRKGYASALVSAVGAVIGGEGRTPILYADMANPDSNKVYRSIGYLEAGQVDEYAFHHGG